MKARHHEQGIYARRPSFAVRRKEEAHELSGKARRSRCRAKGEVKRRKAVLESLIIERASIVPQMT